MLVDVEVEVRDHLQAAERLRDALELEQRRRHQTTSTFFCPKRPSRPDRHHGDQHRAEQDVARHRRLLDQQVLPDERGQVERRHEHDQPPPALELDQRDDADDHQQVAVDGEPATGWSGAGPSSGSRR